MIIYKITNLVNGKIYIGQTVQRLSDRWREHRKDARRNPPRRRTYLQKAIRKYGPKNFSIDIIEHCDDIIELNVREAYWIDTLQTMDGRYGYNLRSGGLNSRLSEETKSKLSRAHKGKSTWIKGRHHSEETRKKISQANMGNTSSKGRTLTQIHRKRIAKALTGNTNKQGFHCSEETKQKISASNLGRPKHTPESRHRISIAHLGKKESKETRKILSTSITQWWKTRKQQVTKEVL